MSNPDLNEKKHLKIKTIQENIDGSLVVKTETYYDKLTSTKEEVVKQITTSKEDLLRDVVSCLDVVNKQQTKELTLTIYLNELNQPTRIVKQYATRKENYNRR